MAEASIYLGERVCGGLPSSPPHTYTHHFALHFLCCVVWCAAFYFALVLFSFYMFQGFQGVYNYGVSVTSAALLALFLSTGSK